MRNNGHCLVQDDDCHWFLIPAYLKEDWDNWVTNDSSYCNPPSYAKEIHNPSDVIIFGYYIE